MVYPSADIFQIHPESTGSAGVSIPALSAALVRCGLIPEAIDEIRAVQLTAFHIDFADVRHLKKFYSYVKIISNLIHAPIVVKQSATRQICLEIPCGSRQTLYLGNLMRMLNTPGGGLRCLLGADTNNNLLTVDLTAAPHLLIAGTTGSGKSVLLNGILSSLIFGYSPEILRLLLIDPKQVEMVKYNDIPHLAQSVITNEAQAIYTLKRACDIMDERYQKMAVAGVKDVRFTDLPRIVIVIDELSDLMIKSGGEDSPLERSIVRIAQLGRAAGIHLVIATQRPTKQVLTGLIRANIPMKIALQTSSIRESVVVLDHKGAEQLTGKGDALLKLPTQVEEIRFQSAYTSDEDICAVVDFWKKTA